MEYNNIAFTSQPPGAMAEFRTSFALLTAARWVSAAMLGTTATVIAIVAVAALGLLLLQGRLPVRRSGTVIVGCFLLFGAPLIAAGIQGSATTIASASEPAAAPVAMAAMPMPMPSPAPMSPPQNSGYDPYAGASLAH